MKKKHYLIISFIMLYVVFVIILGMSIYKTLNPKEPNEIYKSLYDPLEYNIDIIKTNMDEITIGNDKWDWYKLKEINLEDEKLNKTYNLLVEDIRTCYLLSNDLENKVYKNMKILSLKNKSYITDNDLIELRKNGCCLENFDKYNSLVLSDDQELSEKIKKQLSILTDYRFDPSSYRTFYDLLNEESATISQIASLTGWLKVEYNTYKK